MMDAFYSERETEEAFRFLENEELIFRVDGFYALYNNSFLVQRRKKGNERAVGQLRLAGKIAKLLSWFPYVKGVAVSGSLSKNFADERSDIDFFIITAKDRLWVARTFMHLFKKLTYLVGKQHWFCMNYYLDEAGLELKEKNVFTAMETITAMPLRGDLVFKNFVAANEWTKEFFPKRTTEINNSKKIRKGWLKSFAEMIFNNRFGNWLNDRLMKITIRRWQKKTESKKRNQRGIILGIDAKKHYCKPDPRYFQQKVVTQFNLKMEQLMIQLEPLPVVKAV
jgi:predicted nucleotidyltransferase